MRQWVLSFPIPLHLLFAAHPELLTPVLQIVHRVISTFLIQQAGLKRAEAQSGAVTLIQRFGSTANLNIHSHCLVLDGVYCTPCVLPHDRKTAELTQSDHTAPHALTDPPRLSRRRAGNTDLADPDPDSALTPLQAAACTYRIAFGLRAGQKVLTLQSVPNRMTPVGPRGSLPGAVAPHGFWY